jgi:hypothetical protein
MKDIISEAVQEFHKKQESLTKEQFYDCLSEALMSGDFQRCCTVLESSYHEGIYNTMNGDGILNISQKQNMTYMPYRKMSSLEEENEKLRKALEFYADEDFDRDDDFERICDDKCKVALRRSGHHSVDCSGRFGLTARKALE